MESQTGDQRSIPEKWSGDEPGGEVMLPTHYNDGLIQPLLFDESMLGG